MLKAIVRAVGVAAMAAAVAHPQLARADNLWLHSCSYYGNDDVGRGLWSTQQAYPPDNNFSQTDNCASGGAFGIQTISSSWGTHWEQWSTVSPPGINIDSAWTPPCAGGCGSSQQGVLVNCNLGAYGYSASFVWGPNQGEQRIDNNDGGGCPYTNLADGTPINTSFGATHFFGFQLRCHKPNSQTCSVLTPGVDLRGIQLGATETAVPLITPIGTDNLSHDGWIRGSGWKIGFRAADQSGVCDVGASLNGELIQGPLFAPNQAYWDQCDPSGAPQEWFDPTTVDTTQYPDGTALQLTYAAEDAAANWAPDVSSTSQVDNSPVTLTLAGPRDAPLTAGKQDITASSSANPSGDIIRCQIDDGPWTTRGATSARIPISGLGSHRVSCYSQDSAVDTNGDPGMSAIQTWSLKIGEAVSSGISFARTSRACRRTAHVIRCHAASRQRRVAHVAHGRRVTVRGWFATADGAALSHVPVRVLAAPDSGSRHWHILKTVSTAVDGSWRATVPAGPSRLIEAVYRGGPMTESSTSPVAEELVPANSTLQFARVVSFGESVHFWGHLLGGYVPRTGALVVVQAFDRGHWRSIATVRTNSAGGWNAGYPISGGPGSYPLRVHIPRQTGYPWEAADTQAQSLVVRP